MGIRREAGGAIKWVCGDGTVVPSLKHSSIGMSYHRKMSCGFIELVQAGYNSPVFDFRQPADVQYEFGTPPARCQLVARALHFSIGQSESLAGLPQTKTRMHVYPNREITAVIGL